MQWYWLGVYLWSGQAWDLVHSEGPRLADFSESIRMMNREPYTDQPHPPAPAAYAALWRLEAWGWQLADWSTNYGA